MHMSPPSSPPVSCPLHPMRFVRINFFSIEKNTTVKLVMMDSLAETNLETV